MTSEIKDGCVCQGCGSRYKVDLLIPDELWERIKPQGKPTGSGLLCGMCIMNRIEEIGEFMVLNADEDSVRQDAIEKCASLVDGWADEQETAWEEFLASGSKNAATSFHTIFRGIAETIRNLEEQE